MTNSARTMESHGGTLLLLTVYSENGTTRLDRQAVIKSSNQSLDTVNWRTTDGRSEAEIELINGKYEIEISAVGYLSEVKQIQVSGAYNNIPMEVILHRDPSAVDLSMAEAAMPTKARKVAKRGVSALQSGNLKEARKKLDEAYRLAPSNPDLNYLLGYLFYEQKDFSQAQKYLTTATNLSPRHVQALTLLGRVALKEQDYTLATATLEKAIDADPDFWMAHNLLADAYLKQRHDKEARQQAELAIEKGKANASTANLALGQALVNLGEKEKGIKVLRTFMEESPKNPTVPQVREMIAAIEKLDAEPTSSVGSGEQDRTAVAGVDPLLASPEPKMSVKSWQPAGIDEVQPAIAAGVTCPSQQVMEKSGEQVKELVDDVSRIAAIEHMQHQRVDDMGNPSTKETRDYNYIASISEDKPGFLQVDENRSERLTRADYPDEIATSGFAALALVFHPDMRDNFDMKCEGLGNWHGQAAWLVHFKQRPDRPARIHDYKVGGEIYSMRLKGRAWITADKFQIVRIESELVDPMMKIQLRSEQQAVEYGPVRFKGKNLELWLPKNAEIYLEFRKRRYVRSHSFDHYMLFAVDSEEKRKEPTAPPEPPDKPVPNG